MVYSDSRYSLLILLVNNLLQVRVFRDQADGRGDRLDVTVGVQFEPAQLDMHVALLAEQPLAAASLLVGEENGSRASHDRSAGQARVVVEIELGLQVIGELAGDEGRVGPGLAVDAAGADLGLVALETMEAPMAAPSGVRAAHMAAWCCCPGRNR